MADLSSGVLIKGPYPTDGQWLPRPEPGGKEAQEHMVEDASNDHSVRGLHPPDIE